MLDIPPTWNNEASRNAALRGRFSDYDIVVCVSINPSVQSKDSGGARMRKRNSSRTWQEKPATKSVFLICACILFARMLNTGAVATVAPSDKAWEVLLAGIADHNTDRRATAVRVLGLVPNNDRARAAAETALADEKGEVRTAAAVALGEMRSRASIPKLREALNDKESSVVLAAANALRQMRDAAAYKVYYAVLTGKLKGGGGLLTDQSKMLHDPKKMAQFGFEQGIGHIPFVGMGYTAVRAITKDDSSPVRAAAAKVLADDPDPRSGTALVQATLDKSWIVRVAALDAIARRGDARLIPKIMPALNDEKDAVQFTAAAAVVRLAGTKKGK